MSRSSHLDSSPAKYDLYVHDTMALIPETQTFTLFPQLPAELRIAIWKQAANLPRNLDVAAVPISSDQFGFVSQQRIPSILLASTESRKATLEFFEWSYGHNLEGQNKRTRPTGILQNWGIDRICPMGSLRNRFFMIGSPWPIDRRPVKCAINVADPYACMTGSYYRRLYTGYGGYIDPVQVSFYYCEEVPPISGPFDFTAITEIQATREEWRALKRAKDALMGYYTRQLRRWTVTLAIMFQEVRAMRRNLNSGIEDVSMVNTFLMRCPIRPSITFVAFVMDGTRH